MLDMSLQPGEYQCLISESTNIDALCFKVRQSDLEIRDVLSIHTPEKSLFAVLVRSDLSDTVLNSLLKTNQKPLDIDRGRISVDSSELGESREHGDRVYEEVAGGYQRKNKSCYTHKTDWHMKSEGRWPTNQILVHGPACKKIGTKKVKGSQLDHDCGDFGKGNIYGEGTRKLRFTGYTSEDGTEKVDDWDCEPDCPVHLLDLQSGERPGCVSPSEAKPESIYRPEQGSYQKQGPIYGDTGTASRFFYQAKSLEEVKSYFQTLTGSNVLT